MHMHMHMHVHVYVQGEMLFACTLHSGRPCFQIDCKSNGLIGDMLAHELRENLLFHIPAVKSECLLFMCAYTNLMHGY